MNRPNKEDYKVGDGYSCKYIVDLEKYCDELEAKLTSCLDAEGGYTHRIEILEMVRDMDKKVIHKYDIALEKACERLGNESILCPITKKRYSPSLCDSCVDLCKNIWKGKLLKEVQDE